MKIMSYLLSILLCGLLTQAAFGQNPKPMTNDDVVSMVKAGLPEDIVIGAIGAQQTSFDNSAAALVELTKQGVSTKIISAMVAAKPHEDSSPVQPGADPIPAPPAPQTSAAPAGAKQLQGQPAATPQNANQDKGKNNTDNSKGGGGGFFGRLNRVQSQVNGAVQQTQSSVQQGQATVKEAEGTAAQVQPAAAGQPSKAAPPARPAAQANTPARQTNAAAAQTNTVPVQANAAAAERQKITEQMNACKAQASKIDPQMRTPEALTAYSSCVQSVMQRPTQAAKPAR